MDIRELPRGRFDQMAATEAPQGVVAFAAPLREFAVEELVADPRTSGPPGDDDRLYLSAGAEHTERRTPAPVSEEVDHDDEAGETDQPEAGPEESAGGPPTEAGDDGVQDGAPVASGAPEAAAPAAAPTLLLVVDGVNDPGNLGAILRTAECAGVSGVVLPRHRAARITPTVAKRAAGAIEHLRVRPRQAAFPQRWQRSPNSASGQWVSKSPPNRPSGNSTSPTPRWHWSWVPRGAACHAWSAGAAT